MDVVVAKPSHPFFVQISPISLKKFPNFNVFGNFVIIIFENTQKTQYSNNK